MGGTWNHEAGKIFVKGEGEGGKMGSEEPQAAVWLRENLGQAFGDSGAKTAH